MFKAKRKARALDGRRGEGERRKREMGSEINEGKGRKVLDVKV